VMAAASDQFGAPDLGVFGDALEGLGVNPSMLKGADDLISNLSVDKAAQFIDQLSEGELPAFASGLSAKGAVDLFDRFTGSGQDIGATFNKLGGADGPGALLGKIAEGGRLDETLGKLGQDELVSLIKTMVPTTQAPSDAPVQVAGLDVPAGQPRYEADPVTGTDGIPGPRTDRDVDSPAFETDPATGAMVRPRAVQDDALGIENVEAMVQEPIVRSGDEAVLRTFDRTDGGQQQVDGGVEPADAPSVTTMDDPVFAEQAATVSYEDTNDDGGDFSAPPAEDEGGYDEVTDEVFGAE
jgi:hypothetical protein